VVPMLSRSYLTQLEKPVPPRNRRGALNERGAVAVVRGVSLGTVFTVIAHARKRGTEPRFKTF
jgi:hypothetical protein